MRLTAAMTTREIALTMGDAIPGALDVILRLLDNPRGAVAVYGLDRIELYGSEIWIAYKDVCGGDLWKLAKATEATIRLECDLKAAVAEQLSPNRERAATKTVQALIGVKA